MSTLKYLQLKDYDPDLLGLMINPYADSTRRMTNDRSTHSFITHYLDPSRTKLENDLWHLLNMDNLQQSTWSMKKEHTSMNTFKLTFNTLIFPSFSDDFPMVNPGAVYTASTPAAISMVAVSRNTAIKLSLNVHVSAHKRCQPDVYGTDIELSHSSVVDGSQIHIASGADESGSSDVHIAYKTLESIAPDFRTKIRKLINTSQISELYS